MIMRRIGARVVRRNGRCREYGRICTCSPFWGGGRKGRGGAYSEFLRIIFSMLQFNMYQLYLLLLFAFTIVLVLFVSINYAWIYGNGALYLWPLQCLRKSCTNKKKTMEKESFFFWVGFLLPFFWWIFADVFISFLLIE